MRNILVAILVTLLPACDGAAEPTRLPKAENRTAQQAGAGEAPNARSTAARPMARAS